MLRASFPSSAASMNRTHRPVEKGDHVFLVDGSSFVFRAYFQSIRHDPKYNYRCDRLPTGAGRLVGTQVLLRTCMWRAGLKTLPLLIWYYIPLVHDHSSM